MYRVLANCFEDGNRVLWSETSASSLPEAIRIAESFMAISEVCDVQIASVSKFSEQGIEI